MANISGWRRRGWWFGNDDAGGPWGDRGGGGDGGKGSGGGSGGGNGNGGPRNPWSQPPSGRRPTPKGPTALDELLKRAKSNIPGGPGGSGPRLGAIWPVALLAVVAAWLALTALHRIGPQERGVILRFGQYAGTMGPGIGITFPWPVDSVEKVDVEAIREASIPGAGTAENLMLTQDQNLVDLQYSVRWNIRNPERFLFQLAEPEDTVREAAESAMRAIVATVTLDDAIGAGRGDVEQRVQRLTQAIIDDYRAGVDVQGIAIRQADPPGAVLEAFKSVSAAQQTAQTYLNQARAFSQQLTAKAQGDAAAFDKVYAEYRLAPEVTRRRMYYETMERVLSKVDKTIVESPGVTPYLPLPQVQRTRPQPVPDAPSGETGQ